MSNKTEEIEALYSERLSERIKPQSCYFGQGEDDLVMEMGVGVCIHGGKEQMLQFRGWTLHPVRGRGRQHRKDTRFALFVICIDSRQQLVECMVQILMEARDKELARGWLAGMAGQNPDEMENASIEEGKEHHERRSPNQNQN